MNIIMNKKKSPKLFYQLNTYSTTSESFIKLNNYHVIVTNLITGNTQKDVTNNQFSVLLNFIIVFYIHFCILFQNNYIREIVMKVLLKKTIQLNKYIYLKLINVLNLSNQYRQILILFLYILPNKQSLKKISHTALRKMHWSSLAKISYAIRKISYAFLRLLFIESPYKSLAKSFFIFQPTLLCMYIISILVCYRYKQNRHVYITLYRLWKHAGEKYMNVSARILRYNTSLTHSVNTNAGQFSGGNFVNYARTEGIQNWNEMPSGIQSCNRTTSGIKINE